MENTRKQCYHIAKRIYELDENVYRILGSNLGRTFIGKKENCIEDLAKRLLMDPGAFELRSEIALIGNMARTISDKAARKEMMIEYNNVLEEIALIPKIFGSVDILNEAVASLNTSNLKHKFSENDHMIICIGRTHGSAGADIGFKLADKLKINYYDAEIFKKVLHRLGMERDKQVLQDNFTEEGMEEYKRYKLGKLMQNFDRYHGLSTRDAVFFNQSDLLCEMARKEDFVVIGRCADVVLTNNRIPHISIFITAPFEQRVKRMMAVYNMDYKHASKMLKKLDNKHKHYYQFYTRQKWGSAGNYDLCINSASYGIDESVKLIERTMNLVPQ